MRDAIVAVLAEPNLALLVLLAGILLIAIEFVLPGWIVPGTLGGVAAVIAFHSLLRLKPPALAVTLLLAGLALLVGQQYTRWPFLAAAVGTATIFAGAIRLDPRVRIWPAVVAVALCGIVLTLLLGIARRAEENKYADIVSDGIIQGRSSETYGQER